MSHESTGRTAENLYSEHKQIAEELTETEASIANQQKHILFLRLGHELGVEGFSDDATLKRADTAAQSLKDFDVPLRDSLQDQYDHNLAFAVAHLVEHYEEYVDIALQMDTEPGS